MGSSGRVLTRKIGSVSPLAGLNFLNANPVTNTAYSDWAQSQLTVNCSGAPLRIVGYIPTIGVQAFNTTGGTWGQLFVQLYDLTAGAEVAQAAPKIDALQANRSTDPIVIEGLYVPPATGARTFEFRPKVTGNGTAGQVSVNIFSYDAGSLGFSQNNAVRIDVWEIGS